MFCRRRFVWPIFKVKIKRSARYTGPSSSTYQYMYEYETNNPLTLHAEIYKLQNKFTQP